MYVEDAAISACRVIVWANDVQLKRIHGNVSAYEGGGGEV